MKVLLALALLLLCLALGLTDTEPEQARDVDLVRDQIVRTKREPAKKTNGNNRKRKKNRKERGQIKKITAKKKNLQKRKKLRRSRKGKGKGNGKGKRNKINKKKFKKRRNLKKNNEKNAKTCSDSTTVSNQCLENAVEVLKYLRGQVRTFNRKFARIKSFNKTVGNKLGKKGLFEETAKYLLLALGGNISSPSCAVSANKSSALAAYNTLNNCSTAIHDACTMSNTTLSAENITTFDTCKNNFNKTSKAADDCRTKHTTNGTAACMCWSKIVVGIQKIKDSKLCSADATNNGVKAGKNKCMEKFQACRKAEDSAVQLVYTCGSGEVANQTKSTS